MVKEGDRYRFYDEDRNAYLCVTSLKGFGTQEDLDHNSLASVNFSGGNASIVFLGSNTRNMVQYDTNYTFGGSSFSCYNTPKTSVQLYKKYRYTAQSSEELKGLNDGADFRLESSLLVTCVNGEYVYTYDMANDAYSLIIQENSGVAPGHILEDSWCGKVSIVNGQTRLIPDAPLVKVGYATENIPEPLEVTAENFFAVMTAAADARPVKLCNLHVAESTWADETVMATLQPNVNQAPAMNGVRGASQQVPQVALRNVFGQNIANDNPLGYDYIDGMANVAGNTMEVYPTILGASHNIVTEIETISTDNAAPAKVTYYDLSGRPVANPSNGIFIQVNGP
ncbi:MAG: hypothetical protein HUK13_09680, partial [Muribaculaceae bacterium]|nr:hypothetical protein [Muribaculaceae bacterium]